MMSRMTKITTKKPWIEPAKRTASGTSAKYLSGIATKKRITVEIASHKAICWKILSIIAYKMFAAKIAQLYLLKAYERRTDWQLTNTKLNLPLVCSGNTNFTTRSYVFSYSLAKKFVFLGLYLSEINSKTIWTTTLSWLDLAPEAMLLQFVQHN